MGSPVSLARATVTCGGGGVGGGGVSAGKILNVKVSSGLR